MTKKLPHEFRPTAKIHFISALLFLILYLVKLILLFTNKKALQSTRRDESSGNDQHALLVTGAWPLVIPKGISCSIIKLVFVFLCDPAGVIGSRNSAMLPRSRRCSLSSLRTAWRR